MTSHLRRTGVCAPIGAVGSRRVWPQLVRNIRNIRFIDKKYIKKQGDTEKTLFPTTRTDQNAPEHFVLPSSVIVLPDRFHGTRLRPKHRKAFSALPEKLVPARSGRQAMVQNPPHAPRLLGRSAMKWRVVPAVPDVLRGNADLMAVARHDHP